MTPFWRSLVITIAVAAACGFAGARLGGQTTPPSAPTTLRATVGGMLHRDFTLTPEQARQVAAIDARYDRQDAQVSAALAAANDSLANALARDMRPTPQSEAALRQGEQQFGRLQRSAVAYVADVRGVLNDQQRRRYDERIVAALKRKTP